MPRSMADPNYEYRPASLETRAKQSVSQRERLGIPMDACQIFCSLWPVEHKAELWKAAMAAHRKRDPRLADEDVWQAIEKRLEEIIGPDGTAEWNAHILEFYEQVYG